ncbi:MAG: dephospho-CoA kinase [Bacteroidales bacterium]|nr:dephospho-CoA kinase [Bacteroidales bacterium]
MLTVIVTGGIGSGKSAVCALLAGRGIPVYDSDSRTKALYDSIPGLKERIEAELGVPFSSLAKVIFSSDEARKKLESIVHPLVRKDFEAWRDAQEGAPFVVLESAIILSLPAFDGIADYVVAVTAPEEVRIERLLGRGLSREDAICRMASQSIDLSKADVVIENSGSLQALSRRVGRVFLSKNSYICRLENKEIKI